MRSPVLRLTVFAVAIAALASCGGSGSSTPSVPPSNASVPGGTVSSLSQIQHIIVIYQENWSFDALYAQYPGANGSSTATGQLQYGSIDANGNCSNLAYTAMSTMPVPLLGATNNLGPWPCGPNWAPANVSSFANAGGGNPDPAYPAAGMTAQTYSLAQFDPQNQTSVLTGDITHVFWHQQLQIDNGNLESSNGSMDKFVAYSSNPGYVLSQLNGTNMPEGKIAQHYTMADNAFHSAFGGSFLNHQWLICACTPVWNQPLPTSSLTFESAFNPATKSFRDSNVTTFPIQTATGPQAGTYYVVNTTFTQNQPHPTVAADQLLAPIPATTKTIGDLLTDASPTISWKWYSGDWSLAIAGSSQASNCASPGTASTNQSNSPPGSGDCFQYHHQPFAYYARWGSAAPANCANPTPHLCDEQNFFSDLTNQTLPAVSFIKPVGVNNEHPNYSTVLAGMNHVQQLFSAICNSIYWANSIVIITYDENGGRWDHVTPPKIDQWGPGTRVPMIIASPYAKPGFVDHTQYETDSILALIEKRFGLAALGTRDAAATPLTNALNFSQSPLACQSS